VASRIPESTIEEIRLRTDIVDLISSYGVQLRHTGSDYKACCPFHHEKGPSFHVNREKGLYHCFGCGESGGVFTFVQKQEGLSFLEAVRKLAQQCGVEIKEQDDGEAGKRARLYALHAELAAFFRRCLLQAAEAAPAREYLKERDLEGEIGEQFCIGYAPKGVAPLQTWAKKHRFSLEEMADAGVLLPPRDGFSNWYSPFGGRLVFTVCDRMGRPIAFSARVLAGDSSPRKYVNTGGTELFKKSNVLFALDRAARNITKAARREAIVCEGQIDVIRCHACGFNTAVAALGTAFGDEHVQLLKRSADSAMLVFDGDEAGQKAALRVGEKFLCAGMPVRVATLPKGEDPDSLLRTKGPEAFRACLDAAESITAFQVRVLRSRETDPGSIDAVTRVSHAVLEMLAKCPAAVMRETLMGEAARLLNVPTTAMKEDFSRVRTEDRRPYQKAAAEAQDAADENDEEAERKSMDAAAPENNPPPPRELALCEFLFDHEHDASLQPLLEAYAPDAVLTHEFTRRFVKAWLEGCRNGGGLEDMLGDLPPAECGWLNAILLSNDRSGMSELSSERILQDFLRKLWMEAVRRRQGSLPADSSPETDILRLNYSTCIRRLQRDPWQKAEKLMTVKVLA